MNVLLQKTLDFIWKIVDSPLSNLLWEKTFTRMLEEPSNTVEYITILSFLVAFPLFSRPESTFITLILHPIKRNFGEFGSLSQKLVL
jgi:hypothetical protein